MAPSSFASEPISLDQTSQLTNLSSGTQQALDGLLHVSKTFQMQHVGVITEKNMVIAVAEAPANTLVLVFRNTVQVSVQCKRGMFWNTNPKESFY